MPSNLHDFDNNTTESLQITFMKPKRSPQHDRQEDLFRSELSQIIDLRHPLVRLAGTVDWDRLDALFGATYGAVYNARLSRGPEGLLLQPIVPERESVRDPLQTMVMPDLNRTLSAMLPCSAPVREAVLLEYSMLRILKIAQQSLFRLATL